MVLTETGEALLHYIREHVAELDTFFERVSAASESLTGLVSYAMPPSCLLSDHFSLLLQKRTAHPDLRLKVTLAPSPDVLELVVQDRIDFGFVTLRPQHSALSLQAFCDEEYILVSSSQRLMAELRPDLLFEQPVIGYPGADVYYNMWLRHYVSDSRDYLSLLRTGEINSIEGAIKMVVGGLGSAVMPRHCVRGQIQRGELFEYDGGRSKPVTNTIYVASLKDVQPSRRVRQVISWFFEMIASHAPSAAEERCLQSDPGVPSRAARSSGIRKRHNS